MVYCAIGGVGGGGQSVAGLFIGILIAAVSWSYLFDVGRIRSTVRDKVRKGSPPTAVPYDSYNIIWTFVAILAVLSVLSIAQYIVAVL
jgi:hypothetical protein